MVVRIIDLSRTVPLVPLFLSKPLVLLRTVRTFDSAECGSALLSSNGASHGRVLGAGGRARDLVDAVCAVAHHQHIFFLWRPLLPDPKDDMVAELAVAAQCFAVVTHNVKDFGFIDQFGIRTFTPGDYLLRLRGVK